MLSIRDLLFWVFWISAPSKHASIYHMLLRILNPESARRSVDKPKEPTSTGSGSSGLGCVSSSERTSAASPAESPASRVGFGARRDRGMYPEMAGSVPQPPLKHVLLCKGLRVQVARHAWRLTTLQSLNHLSFAPPNPYESLPIAAIERPGKAHVRPSCTHTKHVRLLARRLFT